MLFVRIVTFLIFIFLQGFLYSQTSGADLGFSEFALPDLRSGSFARPGDEIRWWFKIRNSGDETSEYTAVEFYLADIDGNVLRTLNINNANKTLLTINPLKPDYLRLYESGHKYQSNNNLIQLPENLDDLKSATYKIIVKIDPGNSSNDTNQKNNHISRNFSLRIPTPDLYIDSFNLDSNGPFKPEDELDWTLKVANRGDKESGNTIVQFQLVDSKGDYINNISITNGSDKGWYVIDGLNPNTSKTYDSDEVVRDKKLIIPKIDHEGNQIEPGKYQIKVTIDPGNDIEESDEANNTFLKSINIEIPQPDLIISSFNIDTDGPIKPDEELHWTFKVENEGDKESGNTIVQFQLVDSKGDYINNIRITNGSDKGWYDIDGLNPNTSKTYDSDEVVRDKKLIIPRIDHDGNQIEPGKYQIKVTLDPGNDIDESDESNNTFLKSIDIEIPKPDLTISSFNLDSNGPFKPEDELDWTLKVANRGDKESGNTIVQFQLVDSKGDYINNISITNGSDKGWYVIDGLNPNTSKTYDSDEVVRDKKLIIPRIDHEGNKIEPGKYQIRVTIDPGDDIEESDENNNTFLKSIDIEIPTPDLSVFTFNILADQDIHPGNQIDWDIEIRNIGDKESEETAVQFQLLDSNRNFKYALKIQNEKDSLIAVSDISAGENRTYKSERLGANKPIVLPQDIEPGYYFINAFIDPGTEIEDANRNNNSKLTDIKVVPDVGRLRVFSVEGKSEAGFVLSADGQQWAMALDETGKGELSGLPNRQSFKFKYYNQLDENGNRALWSEGEVYVENSKSLSVSRELPHVSNLLVKNENQSNFQDFNGYDFIGEKEFLLEIGVENHENQLDRFRIELKFLLENEEVVYEHSEIFGFNQESNSHQLSKVFETENEWAGREIRTEISLYSFIGEQFVLTDHNVGLFKTKFFKELTVPWNQDVKQSYDVELFDQAYRIILYENNENVIVLENRKGNWKIVQDYELSSTIIEYYYFQKHFFIEPYTLDVERRLLEVEDISQVIKSKMFRVRTGNFFFSLVGPLLKLKTTGKLDPADIDIIRKYVVANYHQNYEELNHFHNLFKFYKYIGFSGLDDEIRKNVAVNQYNDFAKEVMIYKTVSNPFLKQQVSLTKFLNGSITEEVYNTEVNNITTGLLVDAALAAIDEYFVKDIDKEAIKMFQASQWHLEGLNRALVELKESVAKINDIRFSSKKCLDCLKFEMSRLLDLDVFFVDAIRWELWSTMNYHTYNLVNKSNKLIRLWTFKGNGNQELILLSDWSAAALNTQKQKARKFSKIKAESAISVHKLKTSFIKLGLLPELSLSTLNAPVESFIPRSTIKYPLTLTNQSENNVVIKSIFFNGSNVLNNDLGVKSDSEEVFNISIIAPETVGQSLFPLSIVYESNDEKIRQDFNIPLKVADFSDGRIEGVRTSKEHYLEEDEIQISIQTPLSKLDHELAVINNITREEISLTNNLRVSDYTIKRNYLKPGFYDVKLMDRNRSIFIIPGVFSVIPSVNESIRNSNVLQSRVIYVEGDTEIASQLSEVLELESIDVTNYTLLQLSDLRKEKSLILLGGHLANPLSKRFINPEDLDENGELILEYIKDPFGENGLNQEVVILAGYQELDTYLAGTALIRDFTNGNVNSPPTDIKLLETSFFESDTVGSFISKIEVVDRLDTRGHNITSSTDEFYVRNDSLFLASTFNFEEVDNVKVELTAFDASNKSYSEKIKLRIRDTNDLPEISDLKLIKDSVQLSLEYAYFDEDGDNEVDSRILWYGDSSHISAIDDSLSITLNNFNSMKSWYVEITPFDGKEEGEIYTSNRIIIDENNYPPTNISPDTVLVFENNAIDQFLTRIQTEDQNLGDIHTYTIVDSLDSSERKTISIDNDALKLSRILDFEEDEDFWLKIESKDNTSLAVIDSIFIDIQDLNEAPQIDSIWINKNLPSRSDTIFLSYTYSDPEKDLESNSIIDWIVEDQIVDSLRGKSTLLPNILNNIVDLKVQITPYDGVLYGELKEEAINFSNAPPSKISLNVDSIVENTATDLVFAKLQTLDIDQNSKHVYSLTESNFSGLQLTNQGELSLTQGLDFEKIDSLHFSVKSTDFNGASLVQSFTLQVIDINEAPIVQNVFLSPANAQNDQDITVAYSLKDPEGDNVLVTIDWFKNGVEQPNLKNEEIIQSGFLENGDAWFAELRASDSILMGEIVRSNKVIIGSQNTAPHAITIAKDSINENSRPEELSRLISVSDKDLGDTHTIELPFDTLDNNLFYLDSNELILKSTLNYEVKDSLKIFIKAIDNAGESIQSTILIRVIDENDKPTINRLSISPQKPIKSSTLSIDYDYQDEDGDSIFNNRISWIKNGIRQLEFENEISVEEELVVGDIWVASILPYDGKDYGEQVYSDTVKVELNSAPEIVSSQFLIIENPNNGQNIGQILATDSQNDTLVYRFLENSKSNSISIDSLSGMLSVSDSTLFDYEQDSIINLPVGVSDGFIETEKEIIIDVLNINEQPLLVTDTIRINENLEVNKLAGLLEVIDPENDNIRFKILEGNNAVKLGLDSLMGTLIVTDSTVLDYESFNSITLKIEFSDGDFIITDSVLIEIKDVNEGPELFNPNPDFSFCSNQEILIDLREDTFIDEDGHDLIYSIDSLPSGLIFDETNLKIKGTYTGQEFGEFKVTFSGVDPFGLYEEDEIAITINQWLSASFKYDKDTFDLESDQNPKPQISGVLGGIFSSQPGLEIDSLSGQIDLDKSIKGDYFINYKTHGVCSDSVTVPISLISDLLVELDIESNFSQWYGGDARTDIGPRNIGAGQSVTLEHHAELAAFSFKFRNPFNYYDPNGPGYAVDLIMQLRAENGEVLSVSEVSVDSTFRDGWIEFPFEDLPVLVKNKTYIFTSYVKDGFENNLNSGIEGNNSDQYKNGEAYNSEIRSNESDQTLEDFSKWYKKGYYDNSTDIDFLFRLSGQQIDNLPPLVNDTVYAINEHSEINTIIGVIEAKDYDKDELSFTITSGNDLGVFELNESSGELSILEPCLLDFETNETFLLEIQVSDQELSKTAVVTVNLLDIEPEGAGFTYGNDAICQGDVNILPTITGELGGVFKGSQGLVLDSISGEIDLILSEVGEHVVSYEVKGICPDKSEVDITINEFDTNVSRELLTLTAGQSDGTYQWIDCGNGGVEIEGAISRDYKPTTDGSYAVVVTFNGCTITSECIDFLITDIQVEDITNQVKVYPNPSDGKYVIDLRRIYRDISLTVTDPVGRNIRYLSFENSRLLEFELKSNEKIFFANILADGKKASKTLLKNKPDDEEK